MLGDNHFADERGPRPQGSAFDPGTSPGGNSPGWAGQSEDQAPIDLAAYWRLALKYRFLILGCFLAALVVGATITLLMTPVYTAQATLQIDREAARIFDAEGVAPRENMVQGEEFFQTQYGLLRSRSLAERVIESLGWPVPTTPLRTWAPSRPPPADPPRHRRRVVVRWRSRPCRKI